MMILLYIFLAICGAYVAPMVFGMLYSCITGDELSDISVEAYENHQKRDKYILLDKEIRDEDDKGCAFRNFYPEGFFFERVAVLCGYVALVLGLFLANALGI